MYYADTSTLRTPLPSNPVLSSTTDVNIPPSDANPRHRVEPRTELDYRCQPFPLEESTPRLLLRPHDWSHSPLCSLPISHPFSPSPFPRFVTARCNLVTLSARIVRTLHTGSKDPCPCVVDASRWLLRTRGSASAAMLDSSPSENL